MKPKTDSPIIHGSKIWLRAFEPEDLEPYYHAVNDQEIAFWAGYLAPQSMDGVFSWYENLVKPNHGSKEYYFVISPLKQQEFIGCIWLWNYHSRLGGAEMSIYISRKADWGAGYGTDALNALLDFAFGFTRLHRVWLTTGAENVRAQLAFRKAGFIQEGVIRAHRIIHGEHLDSVQMSILRPEWEVLTRSRYWDK